MWACNGLSLFFKRWGSFLKAKNNILRTDKSFTGPETCIYTADSVSISRWPSKETYWMSFAIFISGMKVKAPDLNEGGQRGIILSVLENKEGLQAKEKKKRRRLTLLVSWSGRKGFSRCNDVGFAQEIPELAVSPQ